MSAPLGNAASSWHTPCDRLQLSLPLAIMASQNTPTVDEKRLDDGGFDFLGKELDDNARIWNVYRDEVTADDKAHGFEGWLQTLDVLLIFAGLFSAVVTAFLIDSYKLLQKPDQNDFIAAALYALVVATDKPALLRDLPKPTPLSLKPSSGERWTNALWFMSLIIALAVALLAILAKQWLQEFHRRLSDRASFAQGLSSNDWTRKRWFYLKGITTWPMDSFITYVLPLMLHIALFLFLVGLVIFLWILDTVIAALILCLAGLIFGFYVLCTLLPLWFPDAPTCTPLLSQTLVIVRRLRLAVLTISISAYDAWDRLQRRIFGLCLPSYPLPRVREQRHPERVLLRLMNLRDPSVMKDEGEDERTDRVAEMLKWLIVTCTNENAVMMGFQAVSSLDFDSPLIARLQEATVGMSALTHFGSNKSPSTLDAIRAIRSELVLGRGTWRGSRLELNVPDTMLSALKNLPKSDAILFHAAIRGCLLEDIHHVILQQTSESITTRSALLLLRCKGNMDACALLCVLAALDFASLRDGDYDRIFGLFDSWTVPCSCGTRDLLCLLPRLAEIYKAHGGIALRYSSLPAFVASRILQYFARPGNTPPLVCRRHRYVEVLLDFLHHPGWLHPMVWINITETKEGIKAQRVSNFPSKLYRDNGNEQANFAIDALVQMMESDSFRKLTTHGGTPSLASLPSLSSHDFYSMLLAIFENPESLEEKLARSLPADTWIYWEDDPCWAKSLLEVSRIILIKSILFFFSVSEIEERSGRPYNCTDALLGIAVGISWLKRNGKGIDLRYTTGSLNGVIRLCCWRGVDWSDPIVTHLAQHIRELVPEDTRKLTIRSSDGAIRSAEDYARWREFVATATPCTRPDCPGRTRPDPCSN